jgi:DNA-binding transcriptional MerR regulator/effector-binding domain-containing protein
LKHISIGQFSKLSGLSIRALRLYDAEDLLHPNWVDPNTGYRYYGPEQVQFAQLIRQLRSTEMPLNQIQSVISDPERAEATLNQHRQFLERRLREHHEMLRTLDKLMPQKTDFEAKLRFNSAQPVLMIREQRLWSDLRGVGPVAPIMAEIYHHIERHGISTAGAPLLTYPCPDSLRPVEICCCVPITGHPETTERIERVELPAAEFAYTVHRGPYSTLDQTLERLLHWVVKHQFSVAGDAREIFLENPLSASDPERYRTELAIPVQRSR